MPASQPEDDAPKAVTIVNACLRDGQGGSPTAVVEETAIDDAVRRTIPVLAGTSHAVFVSPPDAGPDGTAVSMRFFTAKGELPACGHGTVAGLAFLAERWGGAEYEATVHTSWRAFTGRAVRANGRFTSSFEPGPIELSDPAPREYKPVLDALGVTADGGDAQACTATLGRPRVLVQVATQSMLAALAPDFAALRRACDRLGLLGSYVYSRPTTEGRVAARMFAPSIDVPEDIANANSTACLAALLSEKGINDIAVDMGDALNAPATITASTRHTAAAPVVHVGGSAAIARVITMATWPGVS